jgi:hypothetical protein
MTCSVIIPASRLPRSMSDRCPLFMSRWTARSSAVRSPCSFVIVLIRPPNFSSKECSPSARRYYGALLMRVRRHSRNDSRNVLSTVYYQELVATRRTL